MKIQITIREGFNPTDYQNLTAMLDGIMSEHFKKGYTDSLPDGVNFLVELTPTWESTNKNYENI